MRCTLRHAVARAASLRAAPARSPVVCRQSSNRDGPGPGDFGFIAFPPPAISPEAEAEAIARLASRLRTGGFTPTTDECRTFLRDRRFDEDEAAEKMVVNLRWRASFRPELLSADSPDIRAGLASGKGFLHSRKDRFGRPVLVVRAHRHVIGHFPAAASERLAVHLIQEGLKQALPPVEALLVVIDLREFSLLNADLLMLSFFIQLFYNYFPRRMGQLVLLDAPAVFVPIWATVRPLLQSYVHLARFVNRRQLRDYFQDESDVPTDLR